MVSFFCRKQAMARYFSVQNLGKYSSFLLKKLKKLLLYQEIIFISTFNIRYMNCYLNSGMNYGEKFSFAALQFAIRRIPRNFEVTAVTSTTAKDILLPSFRFFFFIHPLLIAILFFHASLRPLTSRRRTKFIFSAFFSDLSWDQAGNRVESRLFVVRTLSNDRGTNVIKLGRRTSPIHLFARVFTLSLFHIGSLRVFICIVTNMRGRKGKKKLDQF